MDWLWDQGIGIDSHRLIIKSNNNLGTEGAYQGFPRRARKFQDVRYEPLLDSSQYFWYSGRLFLWCHQRERPSFPTYDEGHGDRIEATLHCFSRSTVALKDVIDQVMKYHRKKSESQTTIRRPAPSKQRRQGRSKWIRVATRPPRPMTTVVLDETQKDDILADIKEYLLPSTRQWYSERGIPYRRGCVSHVPPF